MDAGTNPIARSLSRIRGPVFCLLFETDPMTNPLRLALHYWPHPFPETEPAILEGRPLARLVSQGVHLVDQFPVEFDTALAALEEGLNAYTEGDGSFGCSGRMPNGEIWKVSGTVVESSGRVGCIDLWLSGIPRDRMIALLGAVGCAPDACLVQLPEWGGQVSGTEFCRWLEEF